VEREAIIQSISVFSMGIFKLPKSLCKENIWGDSDEQKKMHWFSWWKICVPKKMGAWDSEISIALI
jgi:hypothetical protein